MKLTIEIADDIANSLVDTISQGKNYSDTVDGNPNPQSKQDFASTFLMADISRYVQGLHAAWISALARKQASQAAAGKVNASLQK